jgi:hypothetical protein
MLSVEHMTEWRFYYDQPGKKDGAIDEENNEKCK